MRRPVKILFLFLISCCALQASAEGPVGYLNFAAFNTPGGHPFFETYLYVVGSSMKFKKNAANKYSATAHVTLSFKRGDSVMTSSSFNVFSPEVSDTFTKPSFVDAHRFWLPRGNYELVYTLDDPNNALHKTITGKQEIRVGYPSDTIVISDAEFLSSFSPSNNIGPYNKCGYTMIPYVFSNYPQNSTRLSFYCEIYHTNKVIPREKFTLKYAIEEDGVYSLDAHNFSGSVQMDADTVVPFMARVPIGNLPTGNYYLSVSVIDNENHILALKRYSFTKDNPGVKSTQIPDGFAPYMANRDTLEESIRCLIPISKVYEQSYVTADSLNWVSMPELKRFFYYFWVARDSLHPLDAWQKYLGEVLKVEHSFDVRGLKGYKTDRGRVYLEYGPPNIRDVERVNPATYPHEIWEYYKVASTGETDVKFVFYSTAIETNNFVLLHSTATGETHNPQWQSALYSTVGSGLPSNLDNEKVTDPTGQDPIGEDVNDEFNNPH